jgi:hypothetical protein
MAKLKHAKALEEQRIRFETEQAKESADHYLEMVQEWKRREKNTDFVINDTEKRVDHLLKKQRPTKKEILHLKAKVMKRKEDENMDQLYQKLFS